MLDTEKIERYKGHISLAEIGTDGQRALCGARVLVVGAGGLGSPVTLYLAAAGVGHIGVVDPDTVSLSNLQRQVIHATDNVGVLKTESARSTMLGVNPHIDVTTYVLRLDADNAARLFADYDLVIDCTDNFEARLTINDACVEMGKPFVYGAVNRWAGQVFTHVPGSADFRDIFGDDVPATGPSCAEIGILNTLVGVVGTLQATEAVKYLTHTGRLLTDRLLTFDALTMTFRVLEL